MLVLCPLKAEVRGSNPLGCAILPKSKNHSKSFGSVSFLIEHDLNSSGAANLNEGPQRGGCEAVRIV